MMKRYLEGTKCSITQERKRIFKDMHEINEDVHFQNFLLAFCLVVSHNTKVTSHDSESADFYG